MCGIRRRCHEQLWTGVRARTKGSTPLVGGIEYCTYDLVIARAAAQVSSKPVAYFMLRRIGLGVEQGFAGHQKTGRADSALQAGMLEKLALQRMQTIRSSDPLDGDDLFTLSLDGQYQTGVDEDPVECDRTGAAVAVVAAFFRTGETEILAQHLQQTLARFAQKLLRIPVDRAGNVNLAHLEIFPILLRQRVNGVTILLHCVGHVLPTSTLHSTDQSTLRQHTHEVGAIFGRTAHI